MTDLTKIEVPYGLLDDKTRKSLRAYPRGIEYYTADGWVGCDPLFCNSTAYRAKARPLTKPAIPWDYVNARWQFCARDDSGDLYLYIKRPSLGRARWFPAEPADKFESVTDVFHRGNCDWRDSLVWRGESE